MKPVSKVFSTTESGTKISSEVSLFQKQLPEKEIEALVKALQKQLLIALDGHR